MTQQKATLIFEPNRWAEQLAYVTDRTTILDESGHQVWVSITPEQGERFAEQGIIVQFFPEADFVDLPAAYFDPLAAEPQPPADLTAPTPGGDDSAYYLVQFTVQPDPEWIDEIEELGGDYVQDNPIHVAVFRLSAAQVTAVRELTFVRWVGLYHPAYALSFFLAGQEEPYAALELRHLAVDPAQIEATETGTLEVSIFDDLTSAEIAPALTTAGATIQTDTGLNLIIDIDPAQVPDLLRVPGVRAVERYLPAGIGNQRAGVIVGINQVRNFRRTDFMVNLDGTGEIAGVLDSGLDAGGPPAAMHPDLTGRILAVNNIHGGANPTNDRAPHGTHVTGTIAGNGTQSAGRVRGMAPAAQIVFHAANLPTGANPNALNFNNFMTGFTNAHAQGARVHSNSWAQIGVTNNFYTQAVSGIIDRFAFLNSESLVVFLSQNAERDANNNGVLDMRSLPAQGVAKNVLCVGASENITNTDGTNRTYRAILGSYTHANFNATAGAPPVAGNFPISDNANDVALFSNRGRVRGNGLPAALRRVKPDLVAPGTNILSTGPAALLPVPGGPAAVQHPPAAENANFYYADTGTSMATPVASGAAVLTRQYYRRQFGQLRRPVLLETLPQFVDAPTIITHSAGYVIGWVRRDTGAGQNHLVAARYDRQLVRQGNIIQLQANVGDQPAPMLARHGTHTFLLHRHGDNSLRLSQYDPNLGAVTGFGTNGVVTLTPASRSEADRLPALCVQGNQVAVVWNQTGGNSLVMQRFVANTGAPLDNSPVTLGDMTNSSSHPFIIHNGTRYAVVWAHFDGTNHCIQMRFVNNNGTPVGTQPINLYQQAAAMHAPHLTWDALNRYLIAWVDSRDHANGSIYSHLTDRNGNNIGQPSEVLTLPAANSLRRPMLAPHPHTGFILLWEDNTQRGDSNNFKFDLYLTFLHNGGMRDGRISGNRLRISDTPHDTARFSGLVDTGSGGGIVPVWQSNDEINADALGVYAVKLTHSGAFQAQADPNTPLIQSGRYVRHQLFEHAVDDMFPVAMTWAGGDFYMLRTVPDNLGMAARLQLMRTNADGLPDAGFGAGGAREINWDIGQNRLALHWANTRLMAARAFGPQLHVFLFDAAGVAVNNFATNGVREIREPAASTISPQLGHRGRGNNLRILVAYGQHDDPTHNLRYAVLNRLGQFTVNPRTLAQANGTARHGWFHYLSQPNRSIAAWHREVTDAGVTTMQVFIRRFRLNGNTAGAERQLSSALPGNSQNAVIAPRPVLFDPPVPTPAAANANSRRREFGAAWQYLPTPTAAVPTPTSQIRFSRINRNGTISVTRDVAVVNKATHATDPQLVWHSNGYGLAWLEQPTGGGAHTLFFTVLDQNGVRVDLRSPGAAAAVPVSDHQVSDGVGDVLDYQLVWNGRTFRVTWTELRAGNVHHMQTALAVPRQANDPNSYNRPYHHPSAALVRATLINGATNIRRTTLPNIGNNPNDGYGWGRLNLRQSLAPLPPVTYYARDDASVASGHTVQYRFLLPTDTRLLRVTLTWTDPPGVRLVNNLNLRLTAPDGRVFVGNRWQPGGPPQAQFSDPLPTPLPANPFEGIHNTEQIVIPGAPSLPPGDYRVEVIGGPFRNNAFQQFPGQPFALVFVGSGTEIRFGGLPGGAIPVY